MYKQHSEASIVDFRGVLAAKMPLIRHIITLVFGRIMSVRSSGFLMWGWSYFGVMPEPTRHFTRNVTSVFNLLVKAKPVRKPILKVENTHMTHRFHTSPQQNHIKSIHRPARCKNAIKSYILHQWKVIDTCVSMHFIICSSLLRLTRVKDWAVWLRTCH